MTSIESYKDSIAEKYVEEFKKELKFFEKIMISPLTKKMKEILKSNKKIDVNNLKDLEDLGFWRNILGIKIGDKQLFENLVNKTFGFLKEKQEKIIQAETEGRLDELSNLVINGKLDNLEHRINDENQTGTSDSTGNTVKQDRVDNTDAGNNDEGISSQGDDNLGEGNSGGDSSGEGSPGKDREGVNSITAGVVTGTAGALVYYEGISAAEKKLGINKLKEAPKEFDAKATKKMMENISGEMSEKLKSPKLSKAQRKVYEKSIKEFNTAAESLDGETAEAFRAYQKLQDRLPTNLGKTMHYDMKTLRLIEGIKKEELTEIIGKNEREIIEFFDNRSIKVSEDLARQLKIAKNADEIKGLVKIFKNGTKLRNVLKGIKGMGVITILFAGFDIWCYLEGKKEAELASKINEVRGQILKDKATMQLIIGLGSVALEALTILVTCIVGGSVAGPWGTVIGIAVGIIAAAASIGYDELYANKKEFYAQNRYDFINQKRTKIKQSIVQLFESDRLDMNSGMKESIKDDRGPNSEIDTMEDAWEALIYQEEIMDSGFYILPMYYSSGENEATFKKTLTKEQIETFEKEKKDMEKIIETRKEYIKQYIDKNGKTYNQLQQSIASNKAMDCVEQILADSKVYSYLKSDDTEPYISDYKKMDVQQYKESYKKKLSEEYPTEFQMFEKLRQENPNHLQEICAGFTASKGIIESSFESKSEDDEPCYSDEEISTMKKNIDFLTKYDTYRNLGTPPEKQINSGIVGTTFDYKYIEDVLLDIKNINKRPVWEEKQSIRYLSCYEFDERSNIENQVSDSIFQNIIYSIAREIHGYDGKNDQFSLLHFYSGDGNDTGIYYDKKWKANIDRRVDRGFTELDANTKDKVKAQLLGGTFVLGAELDSPVEAADNQLNAEFRKKVEAIIDREYGYRENKSFYEKKIIDFIKNNNNGKNGYVEIPEFLAMEAKKAGLGNVYKYLFKIENGQIYAITRGDIAQDNLHFNNEGKGIKYEVTNKLRQKSEYTQEEKNLMDHVDVAEKKLQKIRDVQGSFLGIKQHEDDLDIPVELERIMSQKSAEWDQVKESILYMDGIAAKKYLEQKSEEYYNFFNGMYVGILNQVTSMKASNDMDSSGYFYAASCFIGGNAVRLKEANGKKEIEINESVNESIRPYLKSLLSSTDPKSGKKINELLISDDEKEQERGMHLANSILALCLEKAVLTFDSTGKITNISQMDFKDSTLEKVKKDLNKVFQAEMFTEVYDKYRETDYLDIKNQFVTRTVEESETDSHNEIKNMTAEIIKTMNNVDRASKRKDPEFEVDEKQNKEGVIAGTFKSRGFTEKVTVIMDGNKKLKSIKIDKLNIGPFSPKEGFRIANLINWIKYNIKEYPKGASASGRLWGKYGKYQRSGAELERDVINSNLDVDILDNATVNKYYPSIKGNKEFLNYINSFL